MRETNITKLCEEVTMKKKKKKKRPEEELITMQSGHTLSLHETEGKSVS